MNTNTEDVDLGLVLGSSKYSIQTSLNTSSSGAGVNANSRVDMAFGASDRLSELVWSPHNGVSLKCTNSTVADKKPFVPWNTGPSSNVFLPSQNIRYKRGGKDNGVDRNLTISQTVPVDVNDIFGDKATLSRSCRSLSPELSASDHGNCDGKGKSIMEGENCKDDEEDVQIADIAEVGKKNAGLDTLDGISDCQVDMTINRSFPAEGIKKAHCCENDRIEVNASNIDVIGLHVANLSEALVCSLSSLQRKKEPDDEVTSATGEVNKNKTDMPFSMAASSLKDDLCNMTAKETCISGDMAVRSSNDEDDSHESVKSCNSSALFSKRLKRRSNGEELIIESKRMKKQSPGSTSIFGPDSSFMSWISNMVKVKGLSDSNKKDSSSRTLDCSYDVYGQKNLTCRKTHDSAGLNTGLQTVFQSLSCRNAAIPNNENNSTEESRVLKVADKTPLRNIPGSCDGSQLSKPQIFSADIDCPPHDCESNLVENIAKKGVKSNVPEKGNPHTSLWITRLSTRSPRLEKCNEITCETNEWFTYSPKVNLDRVMDDVLPIDRKSFEAWDDSGKEIQRFTADAEVSIDLNSTSKFRGILPSWEIRSSEAMASLFARRLDTLVHILKSKARNASTCSLTCFFCGNGHDLRECPNVTKTELEDLLLMSSFDRVKESPCLCIRCFQLDHWAISCPLAPSSGHRRSEQNTSFVGHYTDRMDCSSKKPFLGSFPSYQTRNVKKCSSKRASNSNENNRNFPLRNIATANDTVVSSEVYHAIKNLRLSRVDILRWMNSDVSLSHLNGFFLRLRFGKSGGGLEGTGYYVACIAGYAREHNGCKSKKSILVDVGGIRSSIGSQYVSNHDFMEDEIKAWWCRIVGSGCRIPSLHELNSKLNDRKVLGFM